MVASPDVRTELDARFQEFQRLRAHGERYSAVARLAEIFHCLPLLEAEEASRWQADINTSLASVGPVDEVLSTLGHNAERIRRILSVGSTFSGEELILLLTLRIEGDLVEEFLRDSKAIASGVAWNDIDERIMSLAKSAKHKLAFRSSQQQVRRNWGIPIRSMWLDAT